MFIIWKAELRKGTMAMRNKIHNSFFSQCFRCSCSHPMTPVMLNRGSQAPREAHFDSDSGVKLGRAGRSGGKKKHSMMCRYRWFLLYSTAFQPLMYSEAR